MTSVRVQTLQVVVSKRGEAHVQPYRRVTGVSVLVTGSQNLAFGHLELGFDFVQHREQTIAYQAFAARLLLHDADL